MSTSHHLVTVCMVCLLCATHSSCSAHDGVVSENGLRKFQDLRHERFKANNIVTPRGYSRPFRVRYLGKIDKDLLQSKEDSFYTIKDVNYRVGDNVKSEETERLNDRLGTNLVDGGERKDKIYLKNLLLNSNSLKDGIRRRGKSVGNVPIELVYFQTAYMESDPHTKLKDDSGHHRTNYYENKDISIRKLGRRRGVGESVDFIRYDGAKFENLPTGREHLFSDEQEMDNLGVLSNDFDVVERRFRILKSKGDHREADKAVISNILRTEDEQMNRILRDNSNNIEAGSDSNTQISSQINLRSDEATRHHAEDDFKVRSDARILNNLEASSDSNTLISSQINSRHNEAIRYNAEDALKMRRDARILNNLEASSDSNTLISSQIDSRHNEAIRHNAEDDLKVRKDTRILNNLEASSDLNTPISPRLNLRSDEAIKSNIEDNLILGRIRRDAHLPEGEGKKNKKDNETSAEITTPVEYKPNLKNIDVEFYVKKLFMQFGDMETMTMSLEGFDSMLKVLNLDRMVLESKQPPIETVVNGERSNSTNVKCINSVDLISSLNAQSKPHLLHSIHDHDHSETEPTPKNTTAATIVSLDSMKANIRLNAHILAKVCPILLYQKVAQTSYEQQGCIVEREHPKVNTNSDSLYHFKDNASDGQSYFKAMDNRTAVWTYSCLCILVISLCGLLGVAVIPIMHHAYYQQILQFLVALAVGTLSGDALLHLLPHALSPHALSSESGHHDQHSHDAMWKGLVAMVGVIFFYFTEKGLTLITEWRQRKMRTEKVNKLPLRVRVMRNDIGCLKGSGSCSSHTGKDGFLQLPAALSIFKPGSNNKEDDQNAVPSSGKICKHKYSEYPYCYDEIAAETMDDLHVQDQNSSNSKTYNSKNMSSGDKVNDDGPLSVVSLNVMNDQDHANSEPGVNDSLLSGDGSKNPGIANNRVQAKDYKKEDFTPVLDAKKKLETSNGGKRRMGVKIVDKHARSRSADRAAELEDDLRKSSNQEEGYTVIIREHSQAHHGHSHSHGHVHSPPSSLSSVVWMVIMGDGLHNFTDGMAIGAAFSSNIAGGFSTAIAVLCHELPHEIGDFAVLLKAGMSAKRAVCYNLLSSLLCLVGMVVGIAAGHTPEATSWIFAAAAGMFLYIALVDMIPELSSTHSKEGSLCQCVLQLSGLTCGIGIMLLIAMYEEQLKMLFG